MRQKSTKRVSYLMVVVILLTDRPPYSTDIIWLFIKLNSSKLRLELEWKDTMSPRYKVPLILLSSRYLQKCSHTKYMSCLTYIWMFPTHVQQIFPHLSHPLGAQLCEFCTRPPPDLICALVENVVKKNHIRFSIAVLWTPWYAVTKWMQICFFGLPTEILRIWGI